jgi:hypothetical protein
LLLLLLLMLLYTGLGHWLLAFVLLTGALSKWRSRAFRNAAGILHSDLIALGENGHPRAGIINS